MVVKGTKKVYLAREMARGGWGYNNTASTAQSTPRRWSAFNTPWQGELPLQEGMLLLSLHQILQHCLPNFQTTGLVPFPFNDYCHWIETHQQTSWWLSADDLEMNMHIHRLLIPQGWKPLVPKFFYIYLTFGWTIPKPEQCFLAAPQQAPRGISLQLSVRNMRKRETRNSRLPPLSSTQKETG